MLAHPERLLAEDARSRLDALVRRRLAREPIAYLRGEQEFFGRSFEVCQDVLIPRPETELLVEQAVQALDRAVARGVEHPLVVDVGTGSGAIAITLALERPTARIVALDVDPRALALARRNARRLGALNLWFLQADLLAPLHAPIHVLVANLPYIPAARWDRLQPELHWEPRAAILGGPTGLELIERLLEQAAPLLAPAAEALLEIDETQGPAARALASRLVPDAEVSVRQDYAGLDRLLHLRRA